MFLLAEADNFVSNFFAATSIIVAIVFGIINHFAEREKGRLRDELDAERKRRDGLLEKLREYGHKHPKTQTEFVEAILLGPRNSGKSSLIELWTTPWTDIKSLSHSVDWLDYIVHLHQFEPQSYKDELFDMDRIVLRSLRLRVRDYPGEEAYLMQAIRDLKTLNKKVVLIFVMNLDWRNDGLCEDVARMNDQYFSQILVDEIRKHIKNLSSVVSRVMIVFNKADLLPPDWKDHQALAELRKASSNAVSNIESIFGGKTDYHLISARTNKGIVNLLGDVGRVALDDARDRERFEKNNKLERLKEFAVMKGRA
jgi:GTPase SAR1 family protein